MGLNERLRMILIFMTLFEMLISGFKETFSFSLKLPMTYSSLVKYTLMNKMKQVLFFSLPDPFRIWKLIAILIFMVIQLFV